MKPNQENRAPKAVQASLKAIWRGFHRCLRYPSIYHDLWEPQSPIDQAFPDIWNPVSRIIGGTSVVVYDVPDVSGINHSFRKANNNYDLPYEWKWWHEPSGARYFGCFYGDNGAVWDDFKRLGDSAYLVLCHVDPQLSQDDGLHGWMEILHKMAYWYPTPLLRSHEMGWRFWECTSDEDHERWVKPDNGVPYPQHPTQWTLELDVVTSSMAAIELILDDTKAICVGRRLSNFPISYPGEDEAAVQKAIDTCRERSAVPSETSTKGPILLFELRGREWHFEYDTGYGVLKTKYPVKGKGFIGFDVCRYLVSQPDEKKHWKELFRETGQAHKVEGAITLSVQYKGNDESIRNFDLEQGQLWRQFDDEVVVDKKRAIWEQITDIDKEKRNAQRKRKFSDDDNRYATQIQAQVSRAIDEIHKVCEELADHLRERVKRRGCCFIYARDDYLLRLLNCDVPDIF